MRMIQKIHLLISYRMKSIFSIFLVLVAAAYSAVAQTEKRLALVVGNSDYTIGALRNPANDARSMRDALQDCGFEVIIATNAGKQTIEQKVREFTSRLVNYDVGLFFYAGHGLEIDGTNYVVPTDVRQGLTKADVQYSCIQSQWIQDRMAEAGNYDKTNILILDACRNNPFRSWNRDVYADTWIPPTKVPTGVITCFSASQGETASDGDGSNGLYTSILLKHLKTRGITVEEVFKRVRIELLQKGGQVPIESTKLTKTFYFRPLSGGDITPPSLKDTDGDGLTDNVDRCPTEKGDISNYGCPTAKQPAVNPKTTTDLPSNMVLINGGTYTMGDMFGEGESNETQHSVTVSDFYMAKYETTFDEYDAFCDATSRTKPSDSGWGRGNRPVINVSWEDAVAYCKWKTEQTGKTYRLPTEAEWEYAARDGGRKVRFGNGTDYISDANANFDARADYKKDYSVAGQYRGKTVAVTDIPSATNTLGLAHMSGNVWEWCSDWYGAYQTDSQTNPTGAASGSSRVCRGGSWYYYPQYCRSAFRYYYSPSFRCSYLGFRVVCSAPQ